MIKTYKLLITAIILLTILGSILLGKKIKYALLFRTTTNIIAETLWAQLISAAVICAVAIASYASHPEPTISMIIGLFIFILGVILQIVTRKNLHEDRTFQERLASGFDAAQMGIHSQLRHPGSTAVLLLILGFCVTLDSSGWSILLYLLLFVPSTLYSISAQEQILLDQFGERFLNYQQHSNRIFPGIY